MKRFYVIVDLEGVAGVARWDQLGIEGNTPEFLAAVKLCTQELAACVEGILQAAPDAEIWVWDGHYHGSLDLTRFPKGARLLNNAPIDPPYCMNLEQFDGLFFLGQHTMSNTPDANLPHTYARDIEYYKLNGLELGEFGCRAALAGSFGIPTVFVSGDDAMYREAHALIPNISCARVKRGIAPQLAVHLAPADACRLIRAAASQATANSANIVPFVLAGPPYVQEVVLRDSADPEFYIKRGFEQTGPCSYTKTAASLAELAI